MAGKASTDPNVFILPDLGEGVHEAELISWKVSPGDTVDEHDIVAEMETDKALVEVPSPRAGTIKELFGKPGEILKVGDPAWTYEGGGEDANTEQPMRQEPKVNPSTNGSPEARGGKSEQGEEREDAGTVVGTVGGALGGVAKQEGKALATPAVRRLAKQLGIDIDKVPGSGLAGRVTDRDVRAFAESAESPTAATPPKSDTGPSTGAPASRPAPQPSHAQQPMPPQMQPQDSPRMQAHQHGQMHPQMQQQMHQQMMPQQGMGYGTPFMPAPMMLMPYPVPMPMPGAGQGTGVPHAPGYTPSSGLRPVPAPAQKSEVQPGQSTAEVPFISLRRKIAQSLRASVDTAVHFTVMDDADVTMLDYTRREMAQQSGEKLSFLPFVARAVCRVLTEGFGALNAHMDDDAGKIIQHGPVHLGIAADTDSGLMVPVVRDAQTMSVIDLQRGITGVAEAARSRSASREQLSGSTFTISNVGSHAGKYATPVINYPEVAIIAVGRVYDAPVVHEGQVMVGKQMPLSLACDHRVVDGATGALALAQIVRLLEDPQQLL